MSEIKFACPHCQEELPANYVEVWCPFCGLDLDPGQANSPSQAAFASNDATTDGPHPNQYQSDPAFAFLWLLVGLAPILILLVIMTSGGGRPRGLDPAAVFLVCALCNLVGGFGCVRSVKNGALRVIFGLFLAAIFFVLSWVIAIFQACSGHMGM
jgi:hypothetical protein